MISSLSPKLDLHGEEKSMVNSLVQEFITDNYKIGNFELIIIHGKSTNILTKEVHSILKKSPKVLKFHLNMWNLGETFVYLKK